MATEFVSRDLKLRVYVHLRFSVGEHFAFTRPKRLRAMRGMLASNDSAKTYWVRSTKRSHL